VVLLLGACSMTWAGLNSVGGLSGLMEAPPSGFMLSPNGSASHLLNCTALEALAPSDATRAAAHCLTRREWRTFFRLYRYTYYGYTYYGCTFFRLYRYTYYGCTYYGYTFFRLYRPTTNPNPNPDPNPNPNPNPNLLPSLQADGRS